MFFFSVMTTSTPEKQDGLKILNDAIEKIKLTITELGGVFNISMAVSFLTLSKFWFLFNLETFWFTAESGHGDRWGRAG